MQIASKRGDHRCNLILKSIYKDDKNLLGREGGLVFLHRVILICTSRSPQGLTSHLNFTVEFEARFEEYEIHLSAKNNDAWNCRQHMCFRLLQSTTKPALVFKIERWKSTCSSHSHSKKSVQPSVNPLCSECHCSVSIFTTAKRRCSRQRKIFDPPSSTTEQYIPEVMTSLLVL